MIFLTTLGVYLGLLLVGGQAPQVYAHAAMTRNFEIQDEIEVKDDLDRKPDAVDEAASDEISQPSASDYSDTVQKYLDGLNLTTALPSSSFIDEYGDPPASVGISLKVVERPIDFRHNQRFLISRLPRASIDPLLVKDAK